MATDTVTAQQKNSLRWSPSLPRTSVVPSSDYQRLPRARTLILTAEI